MKYRVLVIATAALAVVLGLLCGCGERDVPAVSDENQILNYLRNSEDALQLFAIDSLNTVNYTLPSRPGSYREVIDSIQRTISVSFSKSTVDAGGLGQVREAVVIVEDNYYVSLTKIRTTDTTIEVKRKLTRNAHFLKIGDDSKAFVGWKLYGFGGYSTGDLSMPVRVTLADSSGKINFKGDESLFKSSPFGSEFNKIPTIRLEDIARVPPGTRLDVDAVSDTTATMKVFLTFMSANSAGENYRRMDSLTLYHAVDTFTTAPGTDLSWQTVTFVSYDFVDNWPTVRAMWSIPFRTKF